MKKTNPLFIDSTRFQGDLITTRLEVEAVGIPLDAQLKMKIERASSESVSIFLIQDPDLKYLGQTAFANYIRSIHLASNKEVFNVKAINEEKLAEAMGLAGKE